MNCRVHNISSVKECSSNHQFEDPISLESLLQDGLEDVPENLRDVIGVSCSGASGDDDGASGGEISTVCYSKTSLTEHVKEKKNDAEILWPLNRVAITEENADALLELFGVVLPIVVNFAKTAKLLSPTPFWNSTLPKNVMFVMNLLALEPFGNIDKDIERMVQHGSFSTLHLVLSNEQVIERKRIKYSTMFNRAVQSDNVDTFNYVIMNPQFDFFRNPESTMYKLNEQCHHMNILFEDASVPIMNAILAQVKNADARKEISRNILFKIMNSNDTDVEKNQALQDWLILNGGGEENIIRLIVDAVDLGQDKTFIFLIDHHTLSPPQAGEVLFSLLMLEEIFESSLLEYIEKVIAKYPTIDLNSHNFLAQAILADLNPQFIQRLIDMGADVHHNHDVALIAATSRFIHLKRFDHNARNAEQNTHLLLKNGAFLDPELQDEDMEDKFGDLSLLEVDAEDDELQTADAELFLELFQGNEDRIIEWARLNRQDVFKKLSNKLSKRQRENSSPSRKTKSRI